MTSYPPRKGRTRRGYRSWHRKRYHRRQCSAANSMVELMPKYAHHQKVDFGPCPQYNLSSPCRPRTKPNSALSRLNNVGSASPPNDRVPYVKLPVIVGTIEQRLNKCNTFAAGALVAALTRGRSAVTPLSATTLLRSCFDSTRCFPHGVLLRIHVCGSLHYM